MTSKTLRTLDQIELDLVRVRATHADLLRYAQDLHALPVVNHIYVVGFDYGLFLSPLGTLGSVQRARLFAHAKEANAFARTTRNAKGEFARAYRFDDAVCLCLSLNADARRELGDCLADLYQERADWEDMERAADEGEYYDGFRFRARREMDPDDARDERIARDLWDNYDSLS